MSHPRSTTRKVFHYIYNTVYVLLCLILAALILVTPGDAIRQTYFNTLQYTNIVIIAIAYLVTVLIVLFVYSLRLYVTRTVLASIPKSWIPIGKGDVKKSVREMIRKDLGRSAAIAWQARPKVGAAAELGSTSGMGAALDEDTDGNAHDGSGDDDRRTGMPSNWPRLKKAATVESELGIALPPTKPVWGKIEHPGWGSPDSPDLANIQYSAVLSELPNLIEAKVMSLAPPLPNSSEESPLLDPDAVAVLQRMTNMSMRSYVGRLIDLEVIDSSDDVAEFLDIYERARFLPKPMSVTTFRRLMHLFAELLRSTRPLNRNVLETILDMDGMYSESDRETGMDDESLPHAGGRYRLDIDDDAPQNTSPTTPARSSRSLRSLDSDQSPKNTGSPQSHRRVRRSGLVARNLSSNTWNQYGTAPTTPKSKAGQSMSMSHRQHRLRRSSKDGSTRSGSSANSFAQTRRPYLGGSLGSSSQGSSMRSLSQASEGSVIRLARHEDGGDLPYVLRVADTI